MVAPVLPHTQLFTLDVAHTADYVVVHQVLQDLLLLGLSVPSDTQQATPHNTPTGSLGCTHNDTSTDA